MHFLQQENPRHNIQTTKNKLAQREALWLLSSDQAKSKAFVSISPSLLSVYRVSWAKA